MDQNITRRRGVGTRGVDEQTALNGYTVIAPLTSKNVFLIDNSGEVVHKWDLPYRVGRYARILPNGNLLVGMKDPEAPAPFPFFLKYGGGIYMELDPEGNVVNELRDPLGHHDCFYEGDGHFFYAGLEALSPEQQAALPGGVPGTEAPDGKTYADTIREVKDGKLVWEWKVSEHLDPKIFPLQHYYPREHWPLINAIYPLKDGNILASLRSVSAVIIIEKATGKIIWHLDSTVVAQQHCANELPNGNILIFDNGAFRHRESFQWSRAIEVDRATKEIVWQWHAPTKETFYTPFMGSAQRLPNGNTLVCESAFGRVMEINTENKVCWEYVCPYFAVYPEKNAAGFYPSESNALFRAYKYAPEEIPWLK
ncbi:PQQ enzyme repeat, putative [Cryptococcus deneoformans JEC21]|uniref:PQQ enzyme repeat, putative n=1 Tax=Cryptococcus deneoformans (strain JEC21 / ATCC MYA-565) TaxID=214684 RepID=Q5K927_CRYD1|nr:PQQ enzyme repeat, putative [Cryptococcus neoformans var. neoformans JEC21]AAW46211.1 PQQ enzyme repeat, putative [Cryptococcus neoformans var. neoformans JEC21]